MELLINDVMDLGDRVKHFVMTALNLALVLRSVLMSEEGVKNCPNLRDVIYGRPQTNVIKKKPICVFF